MPAQKKHPSTRARRNKTAGARTLAAVNELAFLTYLTGWIGRVRRSLTGMTCGRRRCRLSGLSPTITTWSLCTAAYNDFVTGETSEGPQGCYGRAPAAAQGPWAFPDGSSFARVGC